MLELESALGGTLKETDPEIFQLIEEEERYQFETVRLIPSENYVSQAVLEASGSVLTNKYSEGYPGKRYYEGQRNIDRMEELVMDVYFSNSIGSSQVILSWRPPSGEWDDIPPEYFAPQ